MRFPVTVWGNTQRWGNDFLTIFAFTCITPFNPDCEMYKIFVNNIPVYLTDEEPRGMMNTCKKDLQVGYRTPKDLVDLVKYIYKTEDLEKVHVIHEDVQQLFSDFAASYELIDAAGGMVINDHDEVLMIYRMGRWDLPKGKVELGESIEEAAIREVEEETGVFDLSLVRPIGMGFMGGHVTHHTYVTPKRRKRILKTTYWYEMRVAGRPEGEPQLAEGITKVEWVSRDKVAELFANTYGSIIDVLCAGNGIEV